MKHPILSIALVVLASGCATSGRQTSPTPSATQGASHLSLLLGERWLDSSDWSPVDDQFLIGLGFDTPLSAIPAEFEAGIFRSKDSSGDVDGITREISAGLRKTFPIAEEPKLHPYVGGGLSVIRGEVETPGPDDHDTSLALYVHGGAGWDLSPEWQVGLDLRFLFGSSIELNGHHGDADYSQLAFFVSYGF